MIISDGGIDSSRLSRLNIMYKILADYLAIMSQMSGHVSRGSAGEYQADERAGVARLRWRVSGR